MTDNSFAFAYILAVLCWLEILSKKPKTKKALLDAALWRSNINTGFGAGEDLNLPLILKMVLFCSYFNVILHV